MAERDIERYFKRVVKRLGGVTRKAKWYAQGHCPDRFVMLYAHHWNGWVELKAPGEKAREGQAREHTRMRLAGCNVEVLDTVEKIDEWAGRFES